MLDALAQAGLFLAALVFLANAVGLIPPLHAVEDLEKHGVPRRLASAMVTGGRVFQGLASCCLLVPPLRQASAAGLAVFLAGATLTAHDFWREKEPSSRERQLTQFLKNACMIGGLLWVAAR